jgi:hypothetical protein
MIDINKTYRTLDGREVRIYATDGTPPHEVHGALKSTASDGWIFYSWRADGKHHRDFVLGLIEVRPRHKRTVWLNVYDDHPNVIGWNTKKDADEPASKRLACIKVDLDFEEGEGL